MNSTVMYLFPFLFGLVDGSGQDGLAPVATGRAGSADQADQDPGYRAASMPAICNAAISCAAVTPEPQYTATSSAARGDREPLAELGRGQEAAVRCEVGGRGQADRTGHVTGLRIDRFDLTAVSLAGPRIDEHAALGQRRDGVGIDGRQVPGAQHHVAGFGPVGAGGQFGPIGQPCGQPTIEDPHIADPGPAQQPPRPGGTLPAVVVVNDDGLARAKSPAAGGLLQVGQFGQRVAAVSADGGAASSVLTRGQTDIYEQEREMLIRQWSKETGEAWVEPPAEEVTDDGIDGVKPTKMWEYRWIDGRDGAAKQGPFDGPTMVAWQDAGYFGEGVEFRRAGEEGPWSRLVDFV